MHRPISFREKYYHFSLCGVHKYEKKNKIDKFSYNVRCFRLTTAIASCMICVALHLQTAGHIPLSMLCGRVPEIKINQINNLI